MIFLGDLIPGLVWLTPAPIGLVEDGWAGIVSDMLRDMDDIIATRPGATVDVLALAERDGELLVDAVVDGIGADDDSPIIAIERAAAIARARAIATCARCGRPGRLRHDRSGWPATRCDDHVDGPSP